MRTVILCAILMASSAASTERYDRPQGGREMDRLCATFIRWQQVMKVEGHPASAYAGTGMERHCPAMV